MDRNEGINTNDVLLYKDDLLSLLSEYQRVIRMYIAFIYTFDNIQ